MSYQNNFLKFTIHFCFILGLLVIKNCGFQPLYAVKDGVSLSILESQIEIEDINGRVGQTLKNALLENFGSESNSNKSYLLEMKLNKSVVPLAFRRDKTVTRFNVIIDSEYTLKNINNGELLTSGTSSSIASYSVVFSEFANLSAAKDAEERAVIDLSKNISRIIGFYLINSIENN